MTTTPTPETVAAVALAQRIQVRSRVFREPVDAVPLGLGPVIAAIQASENDRALVCSQTC